MQIRKEQPPSWAPSEQTLRHQETSARDGGLCLIPKDNIGSIWPSKKRNAIKGSILTTHTYQQKNLNETLTQAKMLLQSRLPILPQATFINKHIVHHVIDLKSKIKIKIKIKSKIKF